jgi:hypothetical protein
VSTHDAPATASAYGPEVGARAPAADADTDTSLQRAAAVLRTAGVSFAALRAAGHARDILVIDTKLDGVTRIEHLVAALKDTGFRYITVDLASGETP